jgi:uncharacterized membrane protein HdeD (DUF308 family)
MKKRPLSITILSCLFLAAAAVGLASHISGPALRHPVQNDAAWPILIGLVGIVCGIYLFRGSNWARWLAVLWIAFHVIISSLDSLPKLAIHTLLLAVFAFFLFRAPATAYFRPAAS